MKKNITIIVATFFFCFFSQFIYSQDDYLHCGSTEAMNKIFIANPELKKAFLEREAISALQDQQAFATGYSNNVGKQLLPIYTIPVVFHIIHQGGVENISDAQVFDAMRILDEDFRMLNSTAANTVSAFQSDAADCEIEFRLAQKDPNGICTNGIDRILSTETTVGDDGSKLNPWPRSKYLNIWVVKSMSSGAAGYAYLPGSAFPSVDGIIILSTYIGSIGTGTPTRSHALTHEIGHFLNLLHPWGNTNDPGVDCSGSDNVTDTPPTEGWTSCNLAGATCGSAIDNVQNFMEYAYCPTMYTAGQKTRMRNALTSSTGQRSSLWTSSNLSATGVSLAAVLCKADFQSNNLANTVCQGNSLTFTDLSWNGVPTSWNWTFPGGTPATSTDSVPVIQYNTPGVYDVGLTVTNGSGSVNTSKTSFVTVNSTTASFSNTFYSEGFEGTSIPNTDWNIRNQTPGGNTWVTTTSAAATGSKSVMITNTSTSDTYIDELISPSINMTAITVNHNLTFKVAFAQKTSTSVDKLQVYVSTNCGLNWTLRYTKSGAALSTAGIQSSAFTPNASQWTEHLVSLSGYSGQTNLYIMFRFTSNGGNNVFIDDINLGGANGIDDGLASTIDFNVYPNPVEENSIISFNILNKQKVELKIYDIIGREVSALFNGYLSAGDHQYSIAEKSDLSPGVYVVTLCVDRQRFTKKLIVK
ncbi:MAG: M43 family zinc metalloprotease [Bacteroidota bacterium]|nr:M43 family zinc metalloprotease [Bacteroidota bacterium]